MFDRFYLCRTARIGLIVQAMVLTTGPCAMQTHEPGQVRNQAAIRDVLCVPQAYLVRAVV